MKNCDENWYAIYTMPRAEKKVRERFIKEDIISFLPTTRIFKQWSDRKKIIEAPLIPSYIFVKINMGDFNKVRRVQGVINFVYYLGKPAIIRKKDIELLKEFIEVSINESVKFEKEDKVKIKTGAFKEQIGIVEKAGKKYIYLYIEELGIMLKAEQNENLLLKV